MISNGIHLVVRVSDPDKAKRKGRPKCCYPHSRCTNQLFMVIDGQFYCYKHSEQFWDDHFIEDHHVIRLDGGRRKA